MTAGLLDCIHLRKFLSTFYGRNKKAKKQIGMALVWLFCGKCYAAMKDESITVTDGGFIILEHKASDGKRLIFVIMTGSL